MSLFSFGKKKELKKEPEKTVANSNEPEKMAEKSEQNQLMQKAGACVVTKSLLNGNSKLKWLFRENNSIGTGWVAFGDTDTQEYIDKAENLSVVDFNTLANIEPTVRNVFYMPYGTDLEFCSDDSGKYFVDTKTGEEIRQAVKHPIQIAFEKNLKFLNKESYDLDFFEGLFNRSDKIQTFTVGMADFPTGSVVLADPLVYLGNKKYQTVLNRHIPKGSYKFELSICYSKIVGIRVAAARIRINDELAVRYELAMPKGYSIENFNEKGVFSFFGVDSGLACFTDESLADEFSEFVNDWHIKNPNKEIYNNYFMQLFKESYEKNPSLQRKNGDFLLWSLPKSSNKLIMFTSGMGDGIYSAYWGFDKDGNISTLTVPFMNPEFF